MPTGSTVHPGVPPGGPATHRDAADKAYRRAWWSLALYPVSFAAAFAVGEGILSALTEDTVEPTLRQVLLAATPGLVVFALPGILAVSQGRRAMKLGRKDGQVPAMVGAAIAVAFVGLNAASYLLGLVVG